MDPFYVFIWLFSTGINLLAAYAEHRRGDVYGRNSSLVVAIVAFCAGLTFFVL